MDEYDVFLEVLDSNINLGKEQIYRTATLIQSNVTMVAEAVERGPNKNSHQFGISELGELQSLGPSFDVATAKLHTLQDIRRTYVKIKEATNEQT